MSIIKFRKKPLLLRNARIDVIGNDIRLVIMDLVTVDNKRVTIGVPPEVAFAMLEDLSISTLGIVKKDKKEQEIMFR